MSGHQPWRELTKHFTAKDRELVESGAAEIVADSDRREAVAQNRPRASRVAQRRAVPPESSTDAGTGSRRIASS